MTKLRFSEAINLALHEAMLIDKRVICFGLGVNDPKTIFSTTSGLEEKFGKERVFDVPTSENALTGIGIGASMNGIKPVMTHQRLDFFLLAMDQLVNSAAKWHYMFGSQVSIPITIRLIIGRGWGQGPTHSQNLQAWFAHIPGLKVVMPTTPQDARDLLFNSIFDPDPVIFLEHRWLHNTIGEVSKEVIKAIGKASILRKGSEITIISMSYLTIESLRAADYLKLKGLEVEVIDLCSVKPIDWKLIFSSIKKTGRLIVCDTGFKTCSVSAEIIAEVSSELFNLLKAPPIRLAMHDVPEPTSYGLTKGFYTRAGDIALKCLQIMNMNTENVLNELPEPVPHDVPGEWFKGPF
tara:strand:+ start:3633 stop:4685 length:1053 start_codon:yes stop_codon:yes gene_type:complete